MKIGALRLGMIGFGHMAQVLFRAIDQAKLIPRSQILFTQRDAHKIRRNEQAFKITATTLETLVERSDLLLLGVRPAQAKEVLEKLARIGIENKKLISILAGVRIAFFQKYLGSEMELLRVMPNLPAEVGEGMSIFCYSKNASLDFKTLSHLLFSCAGEVMEVAEPLMDITCGMAGSCPGFVFRLIDAEARLGEKAGIPYEKALKIAAQTFLGAAKLILKGALPEQLIQQIATPGGTTEAGFSVMKSTQIEKHFQAAIEAAAKKSKEISEQH